MRAALPQTPQMTTPEIKLGHTRDSGRSFVQNSESAHRRLHKL